MVSREFKVVVGVIAAIVMVIIMLRGVIGRAGSERLLLWSGKVEMAEVWGGSMGGIPVTHGADEFTPDEGVFVEVIRVGTAWKTYWNGRFVASSPDEEEFYQSMRAGKEWMDIQGLRPRVLISVKGDVPLREIRKGLITIAKAGLDEWDFLVEERGCAGEVRAVNLVVPSYVGCGLPLEVEPLMIRVDADDRVWLGPRHAGVEGDLEESVMGYAEACRLVFNTPSVARVHLSDRSSYQRMIDVLGCINRNGVSMEGMGVIDDEWTTCQGMQGPELRAPSFSVPRPPSRMVMPLGLAPKTDFPKQAETWAFPEPGFWCDKGDEF